MSIMAFYVISGGVSSRLVAAALVICKIFPSEPPLSEKMLRMIDRITSEILPSYSLAKTYRCLFKSVWYSIHSIFSLICFVKYCYKCVRMLELFTSWWSRAIPTSTTCFRRRCIIFRKRKRFICPWKCQLLFFFFRKKALSCHLFHRLDRDWSAQRSQCSIIPYDTIVRVTKNCTISIPLARDRYLCSLWEKNNSCDCYFLYLGFVSWLPENTVIFLWDQLMLLSVLATTESSANDVYIPTVAEYFQKFLPRLCCFLLKVFS
jgi:hypothetical protein